MPTFKYTAIGPDQQKVTGTYDAFSEQEVALFLRRNGLKPVKIGRSFIHAELPGFGVKVKPADLIVFTRMLATLLKAAVPLDQSLRTLYEQTGNKAFKAAIMRVLVDVESGLSLADAFRNQPKIFDTVFTNMIEAGEASGNLETMLERLAEMLEKNQAIKVKVRGAMIYPAVLCVLSIGSVAVLLLFVLPQFMEIFRDAQIDLPLPTKITVWAADILQNQWHLLLIGAVALSIGISRALKIPAFRYRRDWLILKIKVIGDIVQKAAVARFSRTFATLVASGVTMIDGLDLSADTTGNSVVSEALRNARNAVSMGMELSEPLKSSGVFPVLVTSMISIGEQSGELDQMLNKIAEYYEREVNAAIDNALKLLEPVMLVFMAILVGGIMASLYLPLFDVYARMVE